MSKMVTYIQPRNGKGISNPETTKYESLLTNNKTIIGAINEIYRELKGISARAMCGEVVSGEVACGEGVENNEPEPEPLSFLCENFINKFGGK
ncbi:MAG: hypothetical protein ACRCX2_36140 [Paraclostridium sp.]